MLGLVTATFGAVATYAQDAAVTCTFEMQQKLYGDYRAKVKSKIPAEIRAGIKSGEEFLAKCATPDQQVVVDYLKKDIPIKTALANEIEVTDCFNNSLKVRASYNADEAFRCGKAFIAIKPELAFDIGIALVMVGFENSLKTPPVDKYNVETINLAKKILSEVEGMTAANFGAWSWSTAVLDAQKKPDVAKSKPNTVGWMNYVIGSIMYFNQKSEKDALPYLYKASLADSTVKSFPIIYQTIGSYYLKEIIRIDKERLAAIAANNNEDNEQTLAMLATEKGLADRGIVAYSKAHKFAKAEKTPRPDYIKSLYEKIEGLYDVRFNKKDGVDVYVSTMVNQPLHDPATPVTPIVEAPTPTTTPSTTGTTTPTTGTTTKPVNPTTKPTPTTTPTPVTTKPSTTTPVKPTTTPTKPVTKVNTKPKSTLKKKKGTR